MGADGSDKIRLDAHSRDAVNAELDRLTMVGEHRFTERRVVAELEAFLREPDFPPQRPQGGALGDVTVLREVGVEEPLVHRVERRGIERGGSAGDDLRWKTVRGRRSI